MSTNVNPPLNLKIPRRFSGDVESDAFFRNLITILFQLWERTGGGDDTVSDLENEQPDTDSLYGLFSSFQDVEDSANEVNESFSIFDDYVNVAVVTADYTSVGNEIVICNDALTVTLPSNPDDQSKVKIKRAEGRIVLDGNGKQIDGDDTITFIRRYTCLEVIYTVETDSWHII